MKENGIKMFLFDFYFVFASFNLNFSRIFDERCQDFSLICRLYKFTSFSWIFKSKEKKNH